MSDLIIRRLLVDMEAPVARHWCADDPFRTAFFNALSMSFPVGEQFFIDTVRDNAKALSPEHEAEFGAEVRGFIGQEATHRRLHGLFNSHLESQGMVNSWGPRALKRIKTLEGKDPRHALAVTAAFEHFTSILSTWLLQHPDTFTGSEERLQTLWLWHASEECEHKNVAFDLYRHVDGDEKWRRVWFRRITAVFVTDLIRQTLSNLRRDGTLWNRATWRSAKRFLFGERGVVRETYGPWRAYLSADFHPKQHDDATSSTWLDENRQRFVPVGAN